MKRNGIRLAALGLAGALFVGTLAATPALAYFTDSTTAAGGIQVSVTPKTDIVEEYGNRQKDVRIKNLDDSTVPVFVRAKVFANPKYLSSLGGTNWTGEQADGYLYFTKVLQPGDYTDKLNVKIDFPTKGQIIDAEGNVVEEYDLTPKDSINIIVVYEATPVQFDAEGNQLAPTDAAVDWNLNNGEGE